MEILKDKVRRKHINWKKVMLKLGNSEVEHIFCGQLCKLYRGRSLSLNRCAYYALKTYYRTTTIDELLEKIDQKEGLVVRGL